MELVPAAHALGVGCAHYLMAVLFLENTQVLWLPMFHSVQTSIEAHIPDMDSMEVLELVTERGLQTLSHG